MRPLPPAVLIASLLALPAFADAITFIDHAPWDAARMPVEVDQSQLQGILPKQELDRLIKAGRELFGTKFTTADGVGRPLATQAQIPTHFKHPRQQVFQRASGPDSNACSSCHNNPDWGGAGDFTGNAFTSGGTESADFDTVDAQFSNERNTNHMFGSGLEELLAREMTADLQTERENAVKQARDTGKPVTISLTTKTINYGSLTANPDGTLDTSKVDGIDPDLVVRPFSQKGVFTSLRSFTVTVLNAHLGMQADERFGARMTGEADFDGDGVTHEITDGQVSALVAFQATLAPPMPTPFDNPEWNAMADKGKALFTQIGCAECHHPYLPLKSLKFSDPSPYDTAGTLSARDVAEPAVYDLAMLDWAKKLPRDKDGNYLVPLFGDLKRHVIADAQHNHYGDELMGQSFVPRDIFMTAELWGVADTAPYGHRGDLTELSQAILAHGGEGTKARDAYAALSKEEQNDLITYLMTLRMPK